MKRYRKDVTAWIIISLLLITVFIIYNQQKNEQYRELDDKAPPTKTLNPVVAEKTEKLIQKSAQQDINVVITEKVRSIKRQNKLYKQGRSENGSIVTYAKGGESYHNYGLAIDYAIRNKNRKIIWNTGYDGNDNGEPDWIEVADIAKNLGFEWGGDWNNFKDYPHLQMDFGLSIRQLQKGLRPTHENN